MPVDPVVATVFRIGGFHSPAANVCSVEIRCHRLHQPIGALAVRLVHHEDVGNLHDAGLERLHLVAGPGHEHDDGDVRGADDVHFVLADADRLDDDDVLAGSVEDERDVARSRGRGRPRWPRVAMLRMNTPGSLACAPIRTRSPSRAPPVNGLVGSTAITPTVWPGTADLRGEPIDERALARAGRAGDADEIRAAGPWERSCRISSAPAGRLVLDERDRPRDRARVAASTRSASGIVEGLACTVSLKPQAADAR